MEAVRPGIPVVFNYLEHIAAGKVYGHGVGVFIYFCELLLVGEVVAELRALQRFGYAAARDIPRIAGNVSAGKSFIVGDDYLICVAVIHKGICAAGVYRYVALRHVEIFDIRMFGVNAARVDVYAAESYVLFAVFTHLGDEVVEHERIARNYLVRVCIYIFVLVIHHCEFIGGYVLPAGYVAALDADIDGRRVGSDYGVAVAHEGERVGDVVVVVFFVFFGVVFVVGFVLVAPGMGGERQRVVARLHYLYIRLERVVFKEVALVFEVAFCSVRIHVAVAALVFEVAVERYLEGVADVHVERYGVFVDSRLVRLGEHLLFLID